MSLRNFTRGELPSKRLLKGDTEIWVGQRKSIVGQMAKPFLRGTIPLHLLGIKNVLKKGVQYTTYSYEPFGNTYQGGQPSNNSFQYTGRENDNTGLYYYRARYYSPELQRFISEDPIGFKGGSINLYSYAFNNPINKKDPSGLIVIAVPAGIAACLANPACASAVLAGGAATAVALSKLIETIEVPSEPMPTPDLSNIPERCRIEYEVCKKAADQSECSELRRIAKKALCWTKFLICLAGTGL